MTTKRITALVLVFAMLAVLIPSFSRVEVAALTARQEYFAELIGSFARADLYKTGISAAITTGQAIFESGWGDSKLALDGKNLFGYKAYASWDGKVFDEDTSQLFASYDDMLIGSKNDPRNASPWRAYDDWTDSIADHSTLFNTSDRYAAVRGQMNYKQAAFDIVEGGYTSDEGYAERLIQIIETYGLTVYDDITPNEYGVIAMEMNRAQLEVDIGDGSKLTYEVYKAEFIPPEPEESDESEEISEDESSESSETSDELSETSDEISEDVSDEISEETSEESQIEEESQEPLPTDWPEYTVVWESANPSIAKVDQNGNVTGVSEGVTLIRAKIGNREACCLVDVVDYSKGYDAFILENVKVRSEPKEVCSSSDKFVQGTGVCFVDYADGGWYYCEGLNSKGRKVKGWVNIEYLIYNNQKGVVREIYFAKSIYTVTKGGSCTPVYTLTPCIATKKAVKWESADTTVATVTNGVITGVNNGKTTVTATTTGGGKATITVYVQPEEQHYSGIVGTKLYVRIEPNESSKYRGILATDASVEVIGEEVNGWYHVKGVSQTGTALDGWSKARYINIVSIYGQSPIDDPTPVADDIVFANDDIVVYNECIYGFAIGDKVGKLLDCVVGDVKVISREGEVMKRSDVLGTGAVVERYEGGMTVAAATVIIRGDLNGDGKVTPADGLYIKRHLVGTVSLTEIGTLAADTSCDGAVRIDDYMMTVRQYLGLYEIRQEAVVNE